MFGRNHIKYTFILGHVPALSRAEIIKVLTYEKIEFSEILSNKEVLIVEVKKKLEVRRLQEKLGGTVKIACIVCRVACNVYRVTCNELDEKIESIINSTIQATRYKLHDTPSGKFQFGFSLYGNVNAKEFQKIGLAIKRQLKQEGVNSRFVVSKERVMSSVIVKKEQLIEKGADIVIIKTNDEYYLGYTLAVQDFEGYGERDYGRPTGDDKSGMLPPKLAKIMLNLGPTDFSGTILDPFCGSGTIIQEALLLGYKNIIGSDISQKAIEFTQNNIDWLKTKYGTDVSGVKVYQLDARELTDLIEKESVDRIVTEPYLGPPLNPTLRVEGQIATYELSELYLKSFQEFYKVLKPGGRVVIILPIINGQLMDILEQVKAIGFAIEPLSNEARSSIIYSREGQKVMREIFLFYKVI